MRHSAVFVSAVCQESVCCFLGGETIHEVCAERVRNFVGVFKGWIVNCGGRRQSQPQIRRAHNSYFNDHFQRLGIGGVSKGVISGKYLHELEMMGDQLFGVDACGLHDF